MFIFDSMSAAVLAIIITFVAILAVAVTAQIENKATLKQKLSEHIAEVVNLVITCVFTAEQLDHYREKMISRQPIDNDRILPGSGKAHTLRVIDVVANSRTPIPSVVEQVGDVF